MNPKESLKSNELLFLHQWYKETRLEGTLLISLLSFFLFIALGTALWAHSSGQHMALYATGYTASAILLCIIIVRSVILYRFQWPTEPTLTTQRLELAISEKLLDERPTNESILEHFSDGDTKVILPPHWKKSLPEGFNIQEKSLITIRAVNLQQFFPSKKIPKTYKKGHLILGFKKRPIIAREWQKGLSQWRSTTARGMIFAQIALAGAATFIPLLQQGSEQNTAIITRLLYVYATLLLVVLMNLLFTLVRNRTISQRLSMHWDENSAADSNSTEENLEQLLDQFIETNTSLAVAESLTGGLLQKKITAFSGVSAIFKGGITAYSIESKVAQLSVDKAAAEEANCVSAEISQQMATGAATLFNAHITLATTGYAEKPNHSSAELDTPYAYISLSKAGTLHTERIAISEEKSREEVQSLIADAALSLLINHCLEHPKEEPAPISEKPPAEEPPTETVEAELFEIELSNTQEVNAEAETMDAEAETMDAEAETMDAETQTMDAETQSVDAEAQSVDTEAQSVDTEVQSVDTDAQSVDTDAQSVDTEAQSVDTEAQSVDAEAQSVDTKAQSVDAEAQKKKNALPGLDLDLDLDL